MRHRRNCGHGFVAVQCIICFAAAVVVAAQATMTARGDGFHWFGHGPDECKARTCTDRKTSDRYCAHHQTEHERLNGAMKRLNAELKLGKVTPRNYDSESEHIMNEILRIFGAEGNRN